MFGRDSDNSADANDQSHLAPAAEPTTAPVTNPDPATAPVAPTDPVATAAPATGGMDLPAPAADPVVDPVVDPTTAPAVAEPASDMPADYIMTGATGTTTPTMPVAETPEAAEPAATQPVVSMPTMPVGDAPSDLQGIKQQALQQLSPLVSHLDLSPEDKFRTTMMMIQATDDQNLIKEAYAAAQSIVDEKTRAQALLDVVNEINYFAQQAGAQQ